MGAVDTSQCFHIFTTMPHQPGSEWAWSTAEARPGLHWGPSEGHGTEAQIVDLSSGDGKEQPGPGFIRAGCYFGIVRGGSLVRLAPHKLRAASLCQNSRKGCSPGPGVCAESSRVRKQKLAQTEGSRRSLRACGTGIWPLDSLGRYLKALKKGLT